MRMTDAKNCAVRHYRGKGDCFECGGLRCSNALTSQPMHQLSVLTYETD